MNATATQRAVSVGLIRLTVSTVVSVDSAPLYMFIAVTATRPGIEHTSRIGPNPWKTFWAVSWTPGPGARLVSGARMTAPSSIINAPAPEPQYVHQNTVLVGVSSGRYREYSDTY